MPPRVQRVRSLPPVVVEDTTVREALPFPVVYYPSHYGTFIAFGEDEESTPALCACSEPAVVNLLRLQRMYPVPRYSDELSSAPLSARYFPKVIASASLARPDAPLTSVRLVQGLCHRCNLAAPSLRWCHEMYGTRFVQQFGWYINQTYLRLGIMPLWLYFLPDACPAEIQERIRELSRATDELNVERDRLLAMVRGPKRADIAPTEITYWSNVKMDEAR